MKYSFFHYSVFHISVLRVLTDIFLSIVCVRPLPVREVPMTGAASRLPPETNATRFACRVAKSELPKEQKCVSIRYSLYHK